MGAKDLKKTMLSPEEAAEVLRVNKQTLNNWRGKSKGPAYHKIGGKVFYSQYDIERFVADSIVIPQGRINETRKRK